MFTDQTGEDCQIPFLDCRGYYDLAAEIIGFILSIIILYSSLANYRQLKRQKGKYDNTQYEHSLRRKIRVNLINAIFLIVFVTHIIFSMVLFQILSERTPADVIGNQFQKWYKATEVLFIQFLNVLLLAVGMLYWNGLHFFFEIKELDPPLPFSKFAKYCLWACGVCCIIAFATGTFLTFRDKEGDRLIMDILVLLSSGLSMFLFLFFRFSYYKNIFRSVKLGSKIVTRQRAYNFLVLLSSCARMALYLFEVNGQDLDSLRKYDNCYDILPAHSAVLLSIILVNLLPSFVFSRIFTTFQRQKHIQQANIEQTLFSFPPSEIVSGGTMY